MNRQFDRDATPLAPPRTPFKEATRESTRAPTPEDFSVPNKWIQVGALYAAGLAAAIYGIACYLKDSWHFDIVVLLGVFVILGLSAAFIIWVIFARTYWGGLNATTTVEKITGWDINHDGHIGAPPQIVAYDLPLAPNRSVRGELPGPDVVIREWAAAALEGNSLAYETWCHRFGTITEHGKKVEVYRRFRQVLTSGDRPLAVEQGKHGITLTKCGYDVFSALADARPEDALPLLPSAGVSRMTRDDESEASGAVGRWGE